MRSCVFLVIIVRFGLLFVRLGGFRWIFGWRRLLRGQGHHFKINGEVAAVFDDAVAAGIEGVVPAIGVECVAQQRGAEQELDLVAAHACLEGDDGAGIKFVALDDFEFVRGEQGNAFGAACGKSDEGGEGKTEGFVHRYAFLFEFGWKGIIA